MPTDLIGYLSQRHFEDEPQPTQPGPYLTIAHESGCNATGIAAEITKALRKQGIQWSFMNKEILDQTAEKLQLDKNKMEHEFLMSRSNVMDGIVKALSTRYYKTDKKIRKTITDIIRYEARQGETIIVGRAGAVITADIPRGLHIRLVAPFEWRVKSLCKRTKQAKDEVLAFIIENDRKRDLFLEQFAGKEASDIYFELVINVAKFSRQETIQLIMDTMKLKGLI